MKFAHGTLLLSCIVADVHAFATVQPASVRQTAIFSSSTETSSNGNNPMQLTPELLKLANAFEAIGDDKLRYKQLLYMANQLPAFDPALAVPENKVPGCLSTVFVEGTLDDQGKVNFVGDSDGLLTKGLVALLIRGLSGSTADEIELVNPAFIEKAGIAASLTPGRNNGFLNMLAVMKNKARALQEGSAGDEPAAAALADDSSSDDDSRPMYKAIVTALQALKPTSLDLQDVSYQHAGHMEAGDGSGESHFQLQIVSESFDGLNLVKRHQLIYMVLGEVMPKIHALQIDAKTPAEVQ